MKQQKALLNSIHYLDTEEFKETFPNLSSVIRTRKKHLQLLLVHFSQYLTNDGLKIDGKLFFWGSYNKLMEICNINKNKPKTLSQSLILFALLDLLIKLPQDKIPEKLLNEAKHISAKYNLKKLTNFYMFQEYGVLTLSAAEKIAKNLKDNNISLVGISREYVLRTFGLEEADKVFPQYTFENRRGTSDISDENTAKLVKLIFDKIDEKGYCFVNEVTPTTKMYVQWKKSITEICDSYGLYVSKLNKLLKENYKIECRGYPTVILKREST